jgi:hypothetical protein
MLLPPDDAKDFFRLHASLMGFLMEPRKKRKGARPATNYQKLSIADRFNLHARFASNAAREIEAYLSVNPDRLPSPDLAEIAAWKEVVAGDFVFFRQLKNHHVVIEANRNSRVFLVVGLTQPLEAILRQPIPAVGNTTLLPFRGQIVCDGVISSPRIAFGANLRSGYNELYQTAKKNGELISQLGTAAKSKNAPPSKKPAAKKAANPLQRLVASVAKRLREYREERAALKRFEDDVVPAFQAWVETRFKKEREEAFALQIEIDDLQETLFRLHEGASESLDEIRAGVKEERETMNAARAEGAPMPPPPDDMMEDLFETFLQQTRGLDPWDLDEEEYERTYAGFRESFRHAADGNKTAFERSLLGLVADRSPGHVKLVNSAYRRVAKMLHPDKHSDHDEDTKELWELLRQAKEGNDLETIERIETEWRILRSAAFAETDTPRLKQLQSQLRDDFHDLKDLREHLEAHPMWGATSAKPTKAIEKRVKREIAEEVRELQFLKRAMEARVSIVSRMARKTGPTKKPTKKTAPKKAPGKAEDDQLDFGF